MGCEESEESEKRSGKANRSPTPFCVRHIRRTAPKPNAGWRLACDVYVSLRPVVCQFDETLDCNRAVRLPEDGAEADCGAATAGRVSRAAPQPRRGRTRSE